MCDAIKWDRDGEKRFAEGRGARTDIKFYVTLRPWLTIPTRSGSYNPDWAIVKEKAQGPRLYRIRKTHAATDGGPLGNEERDKIARGHKHLEALETDVSYKWVGSVHDV